MTRASQGGPSASPGASRTTSRPRGERCGSSARETSAGARGSRAARSSWPGRSGGSCAPRARAFAVLTWLLLLPALLLTGAVMIFAFPRFTPAAAQAIETDPWRSLGVGALALLGAPAVMVALFVTGVGIPLGLILLAAYLVALLVGYLVAALFVGLVGVRRLRGEPPGSPIPKRGPLVLRLLAALVVLGILRLVPVLGGLVSLAALLFGMGALVMQLHRAYRGGERAQPAAA